MNMLCVVMGGDVIFDCFKEYFGVGYDEIIFDGVVIL